VTAREGSGEAAGLAGGLSGLGPFFAVRVHRPGAVPAPPWRPLRELTERPEPLLRRIRAVRAALAGQGGEVPLRVAASVMQQGLAARVLAPAVAAAALGGPGWLDLRLGGLWWQDRLGGPVPLSVPEPGGGPRGGALAVALDEVIVPISVATGRLVPVSGRVLRGNAASAISSAAALVAAQRPGLAPAALAAARSLAGHPWLSGEPAPPGPGFRRSSCCLIYQLSPGRPRQVCGDCVLAPADKAAGLPPGR
jgi:FhuF 2Fe-2S C-terminal domain